MSALAGRTVLITRPRAQAGAFCAALASRGARTVAFPTVEIQPVSDPAFERAVATLDGYDWIAFTSPTAVRCFWDRLRALDRAGPPPTVRLAAVGAATAAALEARGRPAAAVPTVYLGTELAGALGALAGRRVLMPRSAIAREETGAALRAAGAVVDEVVVYRTVTARPAPAELRVLEAALDAVTFTSPSTVRGFVEAGGAAAAQVLARAAIACIGPTTAAEARARGLPVAVQPASHTAAALADALEDFFAAAAGSRR